MSDSHYFVALSIEEVDLFQHSTRKVKQGGEGFTREQSRPLTYNDLLLMDGMEVAVERNKPYKESLIGGRDDDCMGAVTKSMEGKKGSGQ